MGKRVRNGVHFGNVRRSRRSPQTVWEIENFRRWVCVRPAECCLVRFTLLNEKASGSLADAEDKESAVFTSLGSLGCVHLAVFKWLCSLVFIWICSLVSLFGSPLHSAATSSHQRSCGDEMVEEAEMLPNWLCNLHWPTSCLFSCWTDCQLSLSVKEAAHNGQLHALCLYRVHPLNLLLRGVWLIGWLALTS